MALIAYVTPDKVGIYHSDTVPFSIRDFYRIRSDIVDQLWSENDIEKQAFLADWSSGWSILETNHIDCLYLARL